HYYFEFELTNDQHVKDLTQVLKRQMPQQEEREGITYYFSPSEAGAYVAVTKDRRVIMASDSFEYHPQRFPAMTATVERLLKETQKSTVGAAFDFKSAERFVRSAVDF